MKRIVSRFTIAILLIAGCASPSPAANHPKNSSLAVFAKDATPNTVYIHKDIITLSELGEMDDESVDKAIDELNEANKQHPKKIVLVINSPGGSVPAGWKLIRAIEASSTPVTCLVDGDADSMAFATLQSCKERVVTRRSVLMAHQIAIGVSNRMGRIENWRNLVNMMRVSEEAFDWQCAKRLKISLEDYKKLVDSGKEWWLTPDEAVNVGAADRVIVSVSEL